MCIRDRGNPGEGKTYFAMRLAAACTNRKPLPGMETLEPFNIIYQTAEDLSLIHIFSIFISNASVGIALLIGSLLTIIEMAIIFTNITVSYTHLDVYKRQIIDFAIEHIGSRT